MKILSGLSHFIQAFVIGFTYLIFTNVDMNIRSLDMGINNFIDPRHLIVCVCAFIILLYLWKILPHCGKTGEKLQIKIILLLSIPIFINILSSLMQSFGLERLSQILFHWRFMLSFIAIGFWAMTKLIVQDPLHALLWISGFSETYKE